jgi:exodeoxyribonuclease V alpha subunit
MDEHTINYTERQHAAIKSATAVGVHWLVGITGPAGSGKTTIIKEACRLLREGRRNVVLAAPTGRAARRISEATGYRALTIHKLLEYGRPVLDRHTGEPIFNPRPARWGGRDRDGNPLDQDDILVDEYAMVSWELHKNLINALKPGARLICFGDIAQLPPIEKHELAANWGQTPFEKVLQGTGSVHLDTVFRQDESSGVLENANRIRAGRPPLRRPDFILEFEEKEPIRVLKKLVLSSSYDFNSTEAQIISPQRKGSLGATVLSNRVQEWIRSDVGSGLKLPRYPEVNEKRKEQPIVVRVNVGDKVVCTNNLYDMRDFYDRYAKWNTNGVHKPLWHTFIPVPDRFMVLNGEVGIVTEITPEDGLIIQLPDRVVEVPGVITDYDQRSGHIYKRDLRKDFDLGYVMTTHKMQGSEVEHVFYLLHPTMGHMISRNNLYTAITRARKSVTIITAQRSLALAVSRTAKAADEARERSKSKEGTWSVGEMDKPKKRRQDA